MLRQFIFCAIHISKALYHNKKQYTIYFFTVTIAISTLLCYTRSEVIEMFKYTLDGGFYEISHKRVENPDGSSYNKHVHPYCEILFFISGDVRFNIDGTIYTPRPFDLIFISDTKYHYLIPEGGVPYENYVIGFSRELCDTKHYRNIFSPPFIVNIRENTELCSFFRRLDYYSDTFSWEDFCTSARLLVSELLINLGYLHKEHSGNTVFSNKQIRDIISVIDENITEKLDAGIIARRLFLSKSYVQNVFSNVMHIGLKQYINQKKIFLAACDIDKGMSPGDASVKYGFTDYSSFYRAYKKTLGMSPTEKKNQ